MWIDFNLTYQETIIILNDGFVYYPDFRRLRKVLTLTSNNDPSHAWFLISSAALVASFYLLQF